MGLATQAPSYHELAVGSYNTTYTPSGGGNLNFNTNDRAFGVGIGTGAGRKDGLIVYKDGTLTFNKLTAAPAVTTDRFYILNNKVNYNGAEVGASELQKITEGSNTGWRILGRDPANYGNIGSDAMDLSSATSGSTTFGATGNYSFAVGNNVTASGLNSVAMGSSSIASGQNSIAIGGQANASGQNSITLGRSQSPGISSTAIGENCTAFGLNSVAIGYSSYSLGSYSTALGNNSQSIGQYSTALGYNSLSIGQYSTSMGNSTYSGGTNSTAMGNNTIANGTGSTAMGDNTIANGTSSTAMGNSSIAKSASETVIGQYNDTLTTATGTWNSGANNRVFTVGTGTASNARASAFTVLQNGAVRVGSKGSYDNNIYTASSNLGNSATQKKTFTINTGKTFTGTQIITATVVNQPGQTYQDAFSVTITEITPTNFKAVIYRLDGQDWGQTPVLHFTITEQISSAN